LISHDLAKRVDANVNKTAIARVIYWDKNSDRYTVACTAKSHYNSFINEVRTYCPHELAQYFPDVSTTASLPAPFANHTDPNVSITPTATCHAKLTIQPYNDWRSIIEPPLTLLPEVGGASSSISSGLCDTLPPPKFQSVAMKFLVGASCDPFC
jgi:hypothetical protein